VVSLIIGPYFVGHECSHGKQKRDIFCALPQGRYMDMKILGGPISLSHEQINIIDMGIRIDHWKAL